MAGELVLDKPLDEQTLDEILDSLTPLQRRFVEEMLVSPSYVQAYRRAGGDARTEGGASLSAYCLINNHKVARALSLMRAKRRVRMNIDQDWVLTKLIDLYERCSQAKPVYDSEGEPTGEYQFDGKTAAKCLDMLMKHVGAYDKDNRQKNGGLSREEVEARLRLRGLDPDKMRELPGGS